MGRVRGEGDGGRGVRGRHPLRRPTSAVKFGSVVVSFCTAEVGRRESSQQTCRGSNYINKKDIHIEKENLQVVDFIMVFML